MTESSNRRSATIWVCRAATINRTKPLQPTTAPAIMCPPLAPGISSRLTRGSHPDRRAILFRVRAGGPPKIGSLCAYRAAFPRARGWTGHRGARCPRLEGFSACARVDRTPACRDTSPGRLFRARAGEPLKPMKCVVSPSAFPRARGWTGNVADDRHGSGGFSACARVDRKRASRRSSIIRLFRVRAGGPVVPNDGEELSLAFPRARGWTAQAATGSAAGEGFSACARVDPTSTCRRRRPCGLFRMRAGGSGRKMDCAAA